MFGLPERPTRTIVILMWIAWMVFNVFVFGLPVWSRLFLDTFGLWKHLCTTPAELIECGDGMSYIDLAESLGRKTKGKYVGCSCGEGVFSDWVCPVSAHGAFGDMANDYFSISYFIGTAPGTGAMVGAAFWPIFFIWGYGMNGNTNTLNSVRDVVKHREKDAKIVLHVLWVSQYVFQFFYLFFLFFTNCVFYNFHTPCVVTLLIAEIVHFIALAYLVSTQDFLGKVITAMCTYTVVIIVALMLFAMLGPKGNFQKYAFFFGECCGFSTMLAITPVVAIRQSYSQTEVTDVMPQYEICAGTTDIE